MTRLATRIQRAGLVLALGVASLAGNAPTAAPTRFAYSAERLALEVREVAGLARGGYPAHGLLKLPQAVAATTKFRLLRDGKPVVSQFRPDQPDQQGKTAQWWLDFQTDMAPYETKRYVVEFGEDVPLGPERKSGHKLTEKADAFLIANAPYITWTVPRDLKGLLRSVDFPPSEFLKRDSPGLLLRDRAGRQHAFSGAARVLRQGPMAVALRFEKDETPASLQKVRSAAELTFPAPVSWVELDWSIDDPLDNLAAVGLELRLQLDPAAPVMVDFGATSTVYASLGPGQEAELNAGPSMAAANHREDEAHSWTILRRDKNKASPRPLALGAKEARASRVEGWAHVMDRKNCLALAIDGFARDTHDRIIAASDGKVALWREYPPGKKAARKRLHLWLHFVFFPPQASAGASPQQMQTPLEVRLTAP
jgi:hypothetical protein